LVEVTAASPLAADWIDGQPARLSRAGLEVRENPVRQKFLLVTDRSPDTMRGVGTALGAKLPATPESTTGDDPACIRLAANRWLICFERAHGLGERLLRTTAGLPAVATDVGDGWVSIDIDGRLSYALLVRGCELDLHHRAFGKGRFAQTQIAGIDVLIRARVAQDGYELLVDRSLATDLWMWLKDRAREMGD
jgi:heterotetrameric sarcosine oxidase gamma subunit